MAELTSLIITVLSLIVMSIFIYANYDRIDTINTSITNMDVARKRDISDIANALKIANGNDMNLNNRMVQNSLSDLSNSSRITTIEASLAVDSELRKNTIRGSNIWLGENAAWISTSNRDFNLTVGSNKMVVAADGSMGINMNSNIPRRGHIHVQAPTDSQYVRARLSLGDGSKGGEVVGFNVANPSSHGLIFSTLNDVDGRTVDGVERMRITNAGNVGIGTSNPTSLLHLSKGAMDVRLGDAMGVGGGTSIGLKGANSEAYIDLNSNNRMNFRVGGSNAVQMTVSSSGLDINGSIKATSYTGNPWKCVTGYNAPIRKNRDGELECIAAADGTCDVRSDNANCNKLVWSVPDTVTTRVCTATEYTTEGSWCKTNKDI
jgi:hypothetical protein